MRITDLQGVGVGTHELRLLADIAINAYVADTRELIQVQFHAFNDPHLEAGDLWAKVRLTEFKRWRANADRPLAYDGTRGANLLHLTRMLSETEGDIPRGLPLSAKSKSSAADFARSLYRMGTAKTRRSVRPPLWSKGTCYPVLSTVISEAKIRLGRDVHEGRQEELIQAAFVHSINAHEIHFVPDARPSVSGGNPSRQPSIFAWKYLSEPALFDDPGQRAMRTPREDAEFSLAQSSQALVASAVNGPWKLGHVNIDSYHILFQRTRLPIEWQISASLTANTSEVVCTTYAWAEQRLKTSIGDWQCQLALVLAYLMSKKIPEVFIPTGSTLPIMSSVRSALDSAKIDDYAAVIQLVRTIPWVSRKDVKGLSDKGQYYTHCSMWLLAWIDRNSPLHAHLEDNDGKLGDGWTKKHSAFFPYLSQ